ncbi:MAG: hypothetical protein ABUL67_00840 [Haliangium ochraceum]
MRYRTPKARTEGWPEDKFSTGGPHEDGGLGSGDAFGRAPGLKGPEFVLFACSDDLGRGHVAAAWFAVLADSRRARAVVASPRGFLRIPPEVVEALEESGASLKSFQVRKPSPDLVNAADLVVTMGETFDRDFLGPIAPNRREHWMVPRPTAGPSVDRARSLRDLIRSRVAMLVFTEGWGRTDISKETARVTLPRRHSEIIAHV